VKVFCGWEKGDVKWGRYCLTDLGEAEFFRILGLDESFSE